MSEAKQIRIGHPAYTGANALYIASSKFEAITVLRERGLTRDAARSAVHKACTRPHGYETVRNNKDDVIEINNLADVDW